MSSSTTTFVSDEKEHTLEAIRRAAKQLSNVAWRTDDFPLCSEESKGISYLRCEGRYLRAGTEREILILKDLCAILNAGISCVIREEKAKPQNKKNILPFYSTSVMPSKALFFPYTIVFSDKDKMLFFIRLKNEKIREFCPLPHPEGFDILSTFFSRGMRDYIGAEFPERAQGLRVFRRTGFNHDLTLKTIRHSSNNIDDLLRRSAAELGFASIPYVKDGHWDYSTDPAERAKMILVVNLPDFLRDVGNIDCELERRQRQGYRGYTAEEQTARKTKQDREDLHVTCLVGQEAALNSFLRSLQRVTTYDLVVEGIVSVLRAKTLFSTASPGIPELVAEFTMPKSLEMATTFESTTSELKENTMFSTAPPGISELVAEFATPRRRR